ncbi:MAG TPA: hypothetical protein VFS92_01885 [Planctomycetota bacterium]|nr:hypothetical protein [Planctomycetota bacterium]
MNLSTLRRLVWCVGGAALLAAGGAAVYALDANPSPRDEKEWTKLFPVKRTDASKLVQEPKPKDEYTSVASWPQGPMPVKQGPVGEAPPPPPPDPLQGVTLVSVAESSEGMLLSSATLSKDKVCFSMRVGECIPLDFKDPNSARGPWRLDRVRAGGFDATGQTVRQDEAVFHHLDTMEEAIRKSDSVSDKSFGASGPGGAAAADGSIEKADPQGGPRRDQPPVVRLVRVNAEKNAEEYEIPEREVEWLNAFASEEAKQISATPVSAEEGGGFRLKSVPASSRLAASGFKVEDRVISVNGEKVSSTENAIAVGKKQHESGTQSFVVVIERAGKLITKTYHSPKKKAKP